ncbi:MAG TPA: SMC family ATPase [Anaerolineae bacterium]|nr:SMC family ATPase [Anaerolineae bacterium]
MLIEWVELINFGSYVQERIPFTPGTNAIVGANGTGKSTIREAVAFALFNKTSRKLSGLLREGAQSGTVVVGLISPLDGQRYEIGRQFNDKTTVRYRVFKGLERQLIVEGASDVEEWVRQHLRIDAGVDLGTLFETTIGVPQGTFTAPFLLVPSLRRVIFDRVLDTDSYTRASDNLRPTVRILTEQAASHRTEIARLEGMLSGLPALRAEQAQLKGDISGLVDEIATDRQSLAGAEENLLKLNEAQAHAKEAELLCSQAETRFDAHQTIMQNALLAFLEADRARLALHDDLPAHTAYVDAENTLQELDTRRRIRDGLLRDQIQARSDLARFTAAKARLPEAQQEVDQATERVSEIERGLIEASHIDKALQELDGEIKRTEGMRDPLMVSMGSLQAAVNALSKQNDLLTDSDIAICPTCGTKLTPEHREELLARNRTDITEHRTSLAELNQTFHGLLAQFTIAKKCQQEELGKLRLLPSVTDLSKAQAQSQRRIEALVAFQLEITCAADGQKLVDRLDRDLGRYADLDNLLSHFQDQRRENKTAHETYVGNLTLGGQVNKRQDQLREVKAAHARIEQVYNNAKLVSEVSRAGYNAQRHANVQREVSNLLTGLVASEAQLTLKRERLTVVKKSLGYLETAQTDLDGVTTELQDTEETHATIQWGRELLREAGPLVTRRLVRQISQEASSIYGELMGDSGRRLQWSDDYEVSLDGQGYSRTFAQLSGGEQMLAALAVRWALLRATSSIDIAFYDEPTANLDPERRQAVAGIISRLKGPSQTFVMSHDDTFEPAADNCIRILKDETGSHVVA